MPRLIIEIDRNGSLFYILDAFLGAYNKRTELWAKITQESADLDRLDAAIERADKDLTGAPSPPSTT